ncbi:hypothetical protein G9A89_000885 [Geosiphon pyriformis]|nr:hypothetical protein G9A89_000885 [Geosiphon pyriformis]
MNSQPEKSNINALAARSPTFSSTNISILPTKPTSIEPPQCWCNRPTVKRRVKKQGENFGRYFWGCGGFAGHEHGQSCEYFEWVPEVDLSNVQLPAGNPPRDSILFDGTNNGTPPNTVSERAAGKMATHQHIPNSTIKKITQFFSPIKLNDVMTSTTEFSSSLTSTSPHNQTNNENTSTPSPSNRHVRFAEEPNLINSIPILVSDEMDTKIESSSGDFMTVPTSPKSTRETEAERPPSPRQRTCSSPSSLSRGSLYHTISHPSSSTSKSQNQLSYQYKYYQNPTPETIPRFTTSELLRIIKQHFDRQEYMCVTQERSSLIANTDLEHARKELETLRHEMQLLSRENDVLMREKALLKRELDEVKEEFRVCKRQRSNTREDVDEEIIEIV